MGIYPKLVEHGALLHLTEGLINCHAKKIQFNSVILNIVVFILFTSVFSFWLYINRKNKLSPYDKRLKDIKEQEYVLTKIRHYQNETKENNSPITSLPITYSPI